MKIKVGIVDDHPLFLQGIGETIEDLRDFEVVVRALNGRLLQNTLEEVNDLPDLMLVDVDMPVIDGYETTVWLQQHHPAMKLIAISMNKKDLSMIKMFKAGCCAYFFKTAEPELIKKVLHQVYTQGYFNPDKVESGLWRFFGKAKKDVQISLTPQEHQFLQLACSQLTYDEIVVEMNISKKIGNGYIDSLFKKVWCDKQARLMPGSLAERVC